MLTFSEAMFLSNNYILNNFIFSDLVWQVDNVTKAVQIASATFAKSIHFLQRGKRSLILADGHISIFWNTTRGSRPAMGSTSTLFYLLQLGSFMD